MKKKNSNIEKRKIQVKKMATEKMKNGKKNRQK